MAVTEASLAAQGQLLIVQPDGPQGAKIGLQISGLEQFKKLDEAICEAGDNSVQTVEKAAKTLGIPVVKP